MKKLFKIRNYSNSYNFGTLTLRLGLGILMIPNHGWAKLSQFSERKESFLTFLGLSSSISLGLAVFAELVCSILIIIGLFTRLAVIPLIITMLVALEINDWQFFGKHELATLFLIGYCSLLLLGPGKFSLDGLIFKK